MLNTQYASRNTTYDARYTQYATGPEPGPRIPYTLYAIRYTLYELPATSDKRPATSDKSMQNKPNFRKAQMNLTSLITANYENNRLRGRRENKPNSNPIQTQFIPAQPVAKPEQTQSNPVSNPARTHGYRSEQSCNLGLGSAIWAGRITADRQETEERGLRAGIVPDPDDLPFFSFLLNFCLMLLRGCDTIGGLLCRRTLPGVVRMWLFAWAPGHRRKTCCRREVFSAARPHISFQLRRFSYYHAPTFDRADKVDVEKIACGRCRRIAYKRTSIFA